MDGSWSDVTASMLRAEYREWTPHVRKLDRRFTNYRFRLIVGGKGLLSVDVRQYSVAAGDVLIMPPGARHGGTTDPEAPLRSYWLSGTIRIRGATVPDALAGLPTLLHPRRHVWRQVLREAEEMCRAIKERPPAYQLFGNAAFTRLIALVWREASESGVLAQPLHASPSEQPWLRLALDYVSRHHAEVVTLADLAGVAHLSRAHFSSAFHRATGLSPFEYLRRYRIQRAKEQLGAGATVADAAAAAGFADPSYFGRIFRRTEGLPPSHFRRSKRSPDSA